jgi:Rps23 Pro-64 3,4-dihydroxylase Tpa1-like proline 4-hydroxylase
MKTCTKCLKKKKLNEFHKATKFKDGLHYRCKDCAKRAHKKWYKENIKTISEKEMLRYRSKKRKSQLATSKKNANKKHPEKNRARQSLYKALKSGKIKKKPCEFCGNKKVEGHHDDYLKPLIVRWLCRSHHLQVHGWMKYK